MNLLLVNDEELTAETMKSDIPWEKYGIDQVFTAYSAESGRENIENNHIDIMLCDIEMPGENGISLLRWARENKKEIECIFLTCHATFEYAREAIELGCQDYLLIPAKYEKIGATVLKVVKRIRQQQEEKRYQEYGKIVFQEKMEQATENCGQKKDARRLVQDMVSYIMKNLSNEELSVNEIADKFYLHPVYINRIFKKEKETSISQFIIGERMKMAADILKTGKIGANAAAEQVGYKSYSNFNITFKKYYGCTPSQFLEKNKK